MDTKSVNALIKQSFGPFHRGDYRIVCGSVDGALTPSVALEYIATSLTLGDPQFGGGIRGKFTSPDGSSLVVIKKFERRARRYAQRYEQKFQKKVDIGIFPDFDCLPA